MAIVEVALLGLIFFLPSIVTYYRNREEFWDAATINVLLGFIAIGWFWAWYYALKETVRPQIFQDEKPPQNDLTLTIDTAELQALAHALRSKGKVATPSSRVPSDNPRSIRDDNHRFFCPACGATKQPDGWSIGPLFLGDPDFTSPLFNLEERRKDPWYGVSQIVTCGNCGTDLPAHLAKLWNNRSESEAAFEWRERFRGHPAPH